MALHMVADQELKILLASSNDLLTELLAAKYAMDAIEKVLKERIKFTFLALESTDDGLVIRLMDQRTSHDKLVAMTAIPVRPRPISTHEVWCEDCRSFLSEASQAAGVCLKCASR